LCKLIIETWLIVIPQLLHSKGSSHGLGVRAFAKQARSHGFEPLVMLERASSDNCSFCPMHINKFIAQFNRGGDWKIL